MKKWLLCPFLSFNDRHTQSRDVPLSPAFNMDVCSSFMAAVVTGRYTTSGHLTSLGIGVGVGAGPVKAELFRLGFSHSHRWWRRMEGLATVRAECVSPRHLCSFGLCCQS